MNRTTYNQVQEHLITCKCGAVINTSSVEYFCPHCNELLVEPIGSKQSHTVYDYSNNVEEEQQRLSTRERGKVFQTQAQIRDFMLSNFRYNRGNIKKRYSLAHDGKIILTRRFGSALGKIMIDDTPDNRLMAKGVKI